MEYIKPVYEIDVDKQEVKNYIENNIEDTEEFEKFLKEVERDIKFKLTNKDSELKKDIDDLLKDDSISEEMKQFIKDYLAKLLNNNQGN